jgi:sugar phosphate permease
VHAFALPIIGHDRGFSASTIGLILGTFTLSVSAIRLVIPALAHRMEETAMIRWGMLGTGAVFALYPLATSPWQMALCAAVLGVTLGSTQPMVMSALHHLTPDNRHGETLAFRSMAINLSSTLMPLMFGAAGLAVGAGALFWLVGGSVAAGSWAGSSGTCCPSPRGPGRHQAGRFAGFQAVRPSGHQAIRPSGHQARP